MKLREYLRKCEPLVVPAVLILAAWFSGDWYGQRKVRESLVSTTDTVVRVVTVYKDFPQPKETALAGFIAVPSYKFITDTVTCVEWAEIAVHDTTVVYLPKEQRYYEEEDGTLRLWVSGYEPSLDRYELDKQTVTVTQKVVEKASRWSIGVSAGYGAAYAGKAVTLAPYIGVGVTYALLPL